MGVTGSGKSTVGAVLAAGLGWDYYDADDFHPQANVEKMAQGTPLEDKDRWPWLEGLAAEIDRWLQADHGAILACSALKESYRQILVGGCQQVRIVHLKGQKDLIANRLAERVDHYMPATLLDSQFHALEEPAAALTVDIAPPPEEIAAEIRVRLSL
jgi:gluconokinase